MGIDIKSITKPIRAFFNGIGQVVFIENVIAGFFNLHIILHRWP